MADYLATNEKAGTGAIMTVNIDFKGVDPDVGSGAVPYINAADVQAVVVTPATQTAAESSVAIGLTNVGPTTFRTNTSVPVGKILRIYRATQDEYGLVQFQALQNVTERDLDLLARQMLYVSMETRDVAVQASKTAGYSDYLARVAIQVANDASNIASSATVTAGEAKSLAASAVSSANRAEQVSAQAERVSEDALNGVKDAVAAAKAATDAAREATLASAQAVADAQEAVDEGVGRFLFPSIVPPTTRDNGDPLEIGDSYLNPTTGVIYYYRAGGWSASNVDSADIGDKVDPAKGSALVGTRLPSKSMLGLSIGRALQEKLYDTVSIWDFVTSTDIVDETLAAADWSPVWRRAFDWAIDYCIRKKRGVQFYVPSYVYWMEKQEICNIARTGTPSGTGMVGIRITGDGDTNSLFVAKKTNTTGCLWLTSDRNTECFEVDNVAFLSDLDEDAATNNGIGLRIDSSLGKGMPGYGDHPRWSVRVTDVFVGGYGATAGDLARRGNWDKGILIQNKWYPVVRGVRCLARYSGNLGARTACRYGVHILGCYSPDVQDCYFHGNWERGCWLEDNYNVSGGVEDFRVHNIFVVGQDYGFGMVHDYDTVDLGRLYEPGGCINVIHANCYKAGITIKNHRQVAIDNLYGYAPREDRAQGELLPAVVVLDGVADLKLTGQFLEPGFYKSNSNASVGVLIKGACEAIVVEAQFGHGGIGLLNNSTYTARKSILLRSEMPTSRRTSDWAPLVEYVDNAGTLTVESNSYGATQDRKTFATGKSSPATYPMALRILADAIGQMYGAGLEFSGKNLSGDIVNQAILRSRFLNTAEAMAKGTEDTALAGFILALGNLQEVFRLQRPSVNNDSYAYLMFLNDSGAPVLQRVKRGAANSGGTGKRQLLVDN